MATMSTLYAACSCGQLHLAAEGDPVRISICHCLACQRRTGSVFGVQARFGVSQVHLEGRWKEYTRVSDADEEERTFRFCPECGSTVFFQTASAPDIVGIPVGAFADPSFPAPWVSVWESRRHSWVDVPAALEHHA
jgi:hypothetical protein